MIYKVSIWGKDLIFLSDSLKICMYIMMIRSFIIRIICLKNIILEISICMFKLYCYVKLVVINL